MKYISTKIQTRFEAPFTRKNTWQTPEHPNHATILLKTASLTSRLCSKRGQHQGNLTPFVLAPSCSIHRVSSNFRTNIYMKLR